MKRRTEWKPLRPSEWIFNAFTDSVNFAMLELVRLDKPWLFPWYGITLDGYDLDF